MANIGVFGIIEIDKKILLLKRKDGIPRQNYPEGVLELPGGTVDPGETYPFETLVRETREEIGVDLQRLADEGQCAILPFASFHRKNKTPASFYYKISIKSACADMINAQIRNSIDTQMSNEGEHTGFEFLPIHSEEQNQDAIEHLGRYDILALHRDAIMLTSELKDNYTGVDNDLEWQAIPASFDEIETTYKLAYK